MRYILFGGKYHYPDGGAKDILGWGDSVDDLVNSESLKSRTVEWWDIYDTETRVIVQGGDSDERCREVRTIKENIR